MATDDEVDREAGPFDRTGPRALRNHATGSTAGVTAHDAPDTAMA
jgi:hypothetical protein